MIDNIMLHPNLKASVHFSEIPRKQNKDNYIIYLGHTYNYFMGSLIFVCVIDDKDLGSCSPILGIFDI